jgi:UDP-glucose 4-epimerase
VKGKRILITGGLGFVGSNLAHRCLELGAQVAIYDCLDPKSGGNMQNIQEIKNSVEVILNDIRNFEGLSACIQRRDIVFSCAAYTSHPNSMKEPLIDIDVNCKGMINILEAARRFNPDLKIVHVGTSTQIGQMRREQVDELHPEFPVDIYSANKSASEKYVLIYGRAYRMRATVVRLANVFGPRSNIRSPEFGFVNYFIGLALRGKTLTVYGTGSQLRNLSYVEDVVDALILAAESQRVEGEVFFAAADRQYSVAEIATAIVQHVGGKVESVEWPKEREAIDFGDAVVSNAKIKQVLGWKPLFDLASGLARTREYFVSRLDRYL